MMNNFFTKMFLEETTPWGAGFRYGFLGVILALLAMDIVLAANHLFLEIVVTLMLLFNHLAFQFHWSPPARITLRAWAYGWIVFGGIFIFSSYR